MTQPDDAAAKAAREAAKAEMKGLIKEAIGEYVTESQASRTKTGEDKKQSGTLFGALGELFG